MSFLWSLIERLNCRLHIGNKSQPGVGRDQQKEPSNKVKDGHSLPGQKKGNKQVVGGNRAALSGGSGELTCI